MLTALRRRLTLLMTALTSLVLAGALVVTWNYATAQYRTAAETLLTQNFSAIVDRLDSADSVSDAWLADQEHNSGCLLFLWDNGAALHFAGTTGSADARNAVEPLLEEGLSPLLDTSLHDSSGAVQRQSAVFTLNEYRCHAALLPRSLAAARHSRQLSACGRFTGYGLCTPSCGPDSCAVWCDLVHWHTAAGDHQLAADRQSAGSDGIGHAAAEGVHRRSRARTAQPAGRSKSKPGRCVPHSCD